MASIGTPAVPGAGVIVLSTILITVGIPPVGILLLISVDRILDMIRTIQDEFKISKVELRLYLEQTDEKLGTFSLITSFVETDGGSVEMIYDEGFRGEKSLLRASEFLTSNLHLWSK